ncbi:MAG: exodeoxyribonuclease VII small subunit [Candidatus Eremiobacteraeota bacterium]|nr:exodeoxyribonuclease VII small subunit [Candidatus Eremiobacteraeota bacterium]MBV9647823.1 exodeoxyribonuclease VII small subunit [Candidatus Eremiobacteraeota bacterium]
MATTSSGEFEKSLARLEEIVAQLDREGISLDESVRLFREGKELAQGCEKLLKEAQTTIDAAANASASAQARGNDEALPF